MPRRFTNAQLQKFLKEYGAYQVEKYTEYFCPNSSNGQAIKRVYYGTGQTFEDNMKELAKNGNQEMSIRERSTIAGMAAEIMSNPNLTLDDLMDTTSPEAIERKKKAGEELLRLHREDPKAFTKKFADGCRLIADLVDKNVKTFSGMGPELTEFRTKYGPVLDGLFDGHNQVLGTDEGHDGLTEDYYAETFRKIQGFSGVFKDHIKYYNAAHNMMINGLDPKSSSVNLDRFVNQMIGAKAWFSETLRVAKSGEYKVPSTEEEFMMVGADQAEATKPNIFSNKEPQMGVLSLLDDEELFALATSTDPSIEFKVEVVANPTNPIAKTYKYYLNGMDLESNVPAEEIPQEKIQIAKEIAARAMAELNATKEAHIPLERVVNPDVDIEAPSGVEIMNGEKLEGVFRKDTINDIDAEIQRSFDKMGEKYPELKPFLKHKGPVENGFEFLSDARLVKNPYDPDTYGGESDFYLESMDIKLTEYAQTALNLDEQGVKDFVQTVKNTGNIYGVMSDIIETVRRDTDILCRSDNYSGAAKGDNLSGKNIAMYELAKKLGRPEMFAKSERMIVKTSDGKEVEGVYSENPEGYNIMDDEVRFKRIKNTKTSPLNTPEGLKTLADTQIFNYITSGALSFSMLNVNYQEKNGAIVGMTLRDSEDSAAFSPVPKEGLIEPMVISESMAEKIMSLTSNDIMGLTHFGINSYGANQALIRLGKLKEMISHPADEITAGKIHIVKDSEWKNYSIESLAAEHDKLNEKAQEAGQKETDNIFRNVSHFENSVRAKLAMPKAGAKMNNDVEACTEMEQSLKAMLDDYKANKLFLRGSKQYDNMGKALENVIECARSVKHNSTPEAFEELRAAMKSLQDTATEYTDLHKGEEKMGRNTEKRMVIGTRILQYASSKVPTLQEESMKRMAAAAEAEEAKFKKTPFLKNLESMEKLVNELDADQKGVGYQAMSSMYKLIEMLEGNVKEDRPLTMAQSKEAKQCMADMVSYGLMVQLDKTSGKDRSLYGRNVDQGDAAEELSSKLFQNGAFKKAVTEPITTGQIISFIKENKHIDMVPNVVKSTLDETLTAVPKPKQPAMVNDVEKKQQGPQAGI